MAQDDDLDFDGEFEDSDTTDEQDTSTEQGDIPNTGETNGSVADPFTEAPETVQSDEEKSAATEQAKKAEAEQAEKDKADFEAATKAFTEAVEATMTAEGRDVSTGTLSVELTQTVKDAYAGLPGAKGKSFGKQYLIDKMQECMVEGVNDPSSFIRARTYMNLSNDVKDTKSTAGAVAKPKVDPTQAHVEHIAALMVAPNLVAVPADVESGWEEKAQQLAESLESQVLAYKDWLAVKDQPAAEGETAPEAPEVSSVVIMAAKLAIGRATGTRKASTSTGTSAPRQSSGHRGDIGAHIKEVFEAVEIGEFLPISKIAKAVTSQYGKDGAPPASQGAIAARLFPKSGECNLDFVRPEGKDEGRDVKGAVRVA